MITNQPAFPLTWLALARLGAVMVPVNTRYQTADAAHVLRTSAAAGIVAAAEFEPLLRRLPPDVPALRHLHLASAIEADAAEASPMEAGAAEAARRRPRRGQRDRGQRNRGQRPAGRGPGAMADRGARPGRHGQHPVHLGHHRVAQGLRAAAPVLDPAGRRPGHRVPLPERPRRAADGAALPLHRPAVERGGRAAVRRAAGRPGRLPPVVVLGQGPPAPRHVLLLPGRDADAAAAHAGRPAGPGARRPGRAVLGDPPGPAPRAGAALGRGLA